MNPKDLSYKTKGFEINTLENLNNSGIVNRLNNSWIDNSAFTGDGQPWFSNIEGDVTDVNGSIGIGQANFEVFGERRVFSEISGIPQSGDWIEFNHSVRPLPLTHDFTQYGLNVSHVYDENALGPFPNSGDQTANLAGVMWKRNISLPVDMSDYVITSASLNVVVNGSGDTDLETPNDHPPFDDSGYASLFDFTRFYVEISDVNNLEPYEIAYFKTVDLGEGYALRRDYDFNTRNFMNDTNMIVVEEDVLIFSLTQILRHDNRNFTITLGIDVDCEDNYPGYELDVWYSLLIKSANLTFTYEKKIDQSTSVSWNQIGNTINGTSVKVTDSKLNFRYKIDQLWPTILSPNSEIRILINNRLHTETIKLSSAITTFQEAKIDGFDLTNIIYPYENITLSIQLFLADEFLLDKNTTISIKDVTLYISYTETFSDPESEPWVFTALLILAVMATVIVGGYLVAYQNYLKYPRPVRKVRKYRKALNRKNTPDVVIVDRAKLFRRAFTMETSVSSKIVKPKSLMKKIPEKTRKLTLKASVDSEQLIDKSLEKKKELDQIVEKSLKKI